MTTQLQQPNATVGAVDAQPSASPSVPRFAPESPGLKQNAVDLGMRLAGRLGVGLNLLCGRRTKGHFGILTYHRIAAPVSGLPFPLHNVTPRRFAEQLRGLQARGYQFWPLEELIESHRANETPPERTACVTFDDGFETVFTEAWPVLKELDVHATVFVNTAYLDCDAPFPFDAWGTEHVDRAPRETWRPLSTAQCREMIDSGVVAIGAHTHTHEDFRGRTTEFTADLEHCTEVVREEFGYSDVTFAFPYGSPHAGFADKIMADAARAAGVICALTQNAAPIGVQDDPFQWGRFNVFPWDKSATLAAKLDGWYGWAPQTRRWVKRKVGI